MCSDGTVTEARRLALTDLQRTLKAAVSVAAMQDGGSPLLMAFCYIVSSDKQLEIIDKDKTFYELSYFSPSSVDELDDNLFKQVC